MWRILTIALIAATLSACGGGKSTVRSALGLNRSAPDEFKVVSRPPLSVPPDFSLRAPEPGAPPTGSTDAEAAARQAVLGESGGQTGNALSLRGGEASLLDRFAPQADTAVMPILSAPLASSGDTRFLSLAGVDEADEDIRSKLYQDKDDPQMQSEPQGRFALPDLFGGSAPEDAASVVDPLEESKRIRGNLDTGRALNEGEVKTLASEPQNQQEEAPSQAQPLPDLSTLQEALSESEAQVVSPPTEGTTPSEETTPEAENYGPPLPQQQDN